MPSSSVTVALPASADESVFSSVSSFFSSLLPVAHAEEHHFDECTKRVEEGKGFEGENCIEEFFHLSHCAQECTAPKLFRKLV
uniref:Ubiquinol-cytochrome C reductase hinge domain-containing protein n=1 Tax=Kalmanozyma brasiliensis (strain GHG001) TaxID=1365824 RepID=V5GW57_KALBG